MESFTTGIVWTFGTRICGLLTGLAVSVIVARGLGPTGRGQIAFLALISLVSTMIAYMGLSASSVYHLNRKKWSLRRLIKSQFLLSTFTAVLGCVVAMTVFKLWPNENRIELPTLAMALVVLSIPVTIYNNNIGSILSALREFKKLSFNSVITAIIAIPCYWFALWHFNGGVVGWSLICALISILGLIITCIFAFPKIFHQPHSFEHESFSIPGDCSKLLSYGVISQLGNIAWFLILKADQFIISIFLSVEALGYYAIAAGIAENLRVIPMTIGQVLFPFATEKEDEERRLFISTCVRLTFWALFPIGIILILIGKPIILTLYGIEFIDAVLPFQILIGAIIALAIGNILGYEFVSIGRPKVILFCNLICGLFNISMNLIVIPRYGLIGASWVSFMTYALNSIILIRLAQKASKYNVIDMLKPSKRDLLIIRDALGKFMKLHSKDSVAPSVLHS